MAIQQKDKQRQNKLDTDTWSFREIAVTAKPCKTKLLSGQEKFKESKLGKHLFQGLANSAQSCGPLSEMAILHFKFSDHLLFSSILM